MENKNSNESREMTQEELDKIVGGYISSRPNIPQQQRMPGLPCPHCNNLIPISIHQILLIGVLFCPMCGIKLTIDKHKSEKAQQILGKAEEAIKRVDK